MPNSTGSKRTWLQSLPYLLFGAVIAFFVKTDCDFFLYFAPFTPENSFSNEVIWITGASSGIGAEMAKLLAKSGADLILSARRENLLIEVGKECEALSQKKPFILPFDATDSEEQKNAFDKVMESFGKVDRLILNAGRSQRMVALEAPLSATNEIMSLNFFSYVQLAKLVLPTMDSKRNGQVWLNILHD